MSEAIPYRCSNPQPIASISSLHWVRLCAVWLCIALACSFAVPANAQPVPETTANSSQETEAVVADPLGRETPRSAVTSLLDALARQDYEGASAYLNIGSGARENRGERLARALQDSLDGGGQLASFALLSNDPEGRRDDQLPLDMERVGTLGDPEETPILLVRTDGPDGVPVWQVSQDTLGALTPATIPEPAEAEEVAMLAGAPLEDWLKLLGVAAGSFLLYWLATTVALWIAKRLLTGNRSQFLLHFVQAALPPFSLLLAVLTFQLWTQDVEASIIARQTILRYIGILGWIALAWFALRLADALTRITALRMERNQRRQAASLVVLIRRGLKIAIVAVAVLAIFDTLGFDVTTGVAALGVGGIALALGAQKTVENLVGCITVIADRPVEVGDVCRVGDTLGTVTDIGIRSTRIRTLQRTMVTIPNSDFASERIENYTRRDRFLFDPGIGLVYDTNAAGMREALRLIRDVLAADPRVIDEDARARFVSFGASSLDIEIFAYIACDEYAESLAIREELLLAIMEALETGGFTIAFPTQTIQLEEIAPNKSLAGRSRHVPFD